MLINEILDALKNVWMNQILGYRIIFFIYGMIAFVLLYTDTQ